MKFFPERRLVGLAHTFLFDTGRGTLKRRVLSDDHVLARHGGAEAFHEAILARGYECVVAVSPSRSTGKGWWLLYEGKVRSPR